jgi:hypothetical protein
VHLFRESFRGLTSVSSVVVVDALDHPTGSLTLYEELSSHFALDPLWATPRDFLEDSISVSTDRGSEDLTSSASRTPSITMANPQDRSVPSSFSICGSFSGKGALSASRWLKRFEWEIQAYAVGGVVPSARYLSTLDLLLTDEAADWAETNPDVINLLLDPAPTELTIAHFKSLFQERFPAKSLEISPVSFDVELNDLRQRPDESLLAYYKRVLCMMQRVGAKDRPTANAGVLSLLESAMLDTILRAFIKGIADEDVRRDSTKMLASSERSLRGVYALAEESRRTKLELQKLRDEEAKSKELDFYREVVQKTMTPSQIQVLMATYHDKESPSYFFRSEPRPHLPMTLPNPQAPPPQGFPQNGYQPSLQQYPPHYPSNPALKPLQAYSQYDRPNQQPGQQYLGNNQHYPNQHRPSVTQNDYAPPQRINPPPPSRREPFHAWTSSNYNQNAGPSSAGPTQAGPSNTGPSFTEKGKQPEGRLEDPLRKPRPPLPVLEDLPDRANSGNRYVNGSLKWSPEQGPLCVKCGEAGHISPECAGELLEDWERAHLRIIVFGARNVNSVSAGYAGPPGSGYRSPSMTTQAFTPPMTPSPHEAASSSVSANSISVGSALAKGPSGDSLLAQSFLGEGSGPNKRAHMEEPLPVPTLPQVPPQGVSQNNPQVNPAVPPVPVVPIYPQGYPMGHPVPVPAPPAEEIRPKRKGQKRVGKRVEMQPLVGMLDDITGIYDKPLSVRQVLKHNKVDISLMDWIAWSPSACKELKRLCTRVSKKRAKKQPPVLQAPVPYPPAMSYPGSFPGWQPQNAPGSLPAQHVEAGSDGQTRLVTSTLQSEKAFRIPCTIRLGAMEVPISRGEVQADQGSDMNVISMGMVRKLSLEMFSLDTIGFRGLTMRTADHTEHPLLYWVTFEVGVQGIWRQVRCFVSPQVVVMPSFMEEPVSLLLGIPWLFSVNAVISIRESKIEVGDVSLGETVRVVQGPELVFSSEHRILMYPKKRIAREIDDSSESDESSESEDELSDIDEVPR